MRAPSTCNVTIDLSASNYTPLAESGIYLRAVVRKNGAVVPDGTSVFFTTDFGYFAESGFPNVSKVTAGGVAEVALISLSPGISSVAASVECAKATRSIEWRPVPVQGPFISSLSPTSGSCAGGETVTISGGRFGSDATAVRVTFGGVQASIQAVTPNQIIVRTPARTLANPLVPEEVDVVVTLDPGTAGEIKTTPAKYRYFCVDKRTSITSVNPDRGVPDGGEIVEISGVNFGNEQATTRVTFGNAIASVLTVSETTITVKTPRYALKDPGVPEIVDVTVTRDLGKVSEQSAVLSRAFTFRTVQAVAITSIAPASGGTAGGETVRITGVNFGQELATTRAAFGTVQATVESVTNTEMIVRTPRWTLKDPKVSETVDVVVVVGFGTSSQAVATLAKAYTFLPPAGIAVTSVAPTSGSPVGGDTVRIVGTGFGTAADTAKVVFGTLPATIQTVTDTEIVALTPRYTLKDPAVSEIVDITVTVASGLPGERSATLSKAFTYLATQMAITSISPETGSPNGGETVAIRGNNFGESPQLTNVFFGTVPATILGVTRTEITVQTPRWTLKNPSVSETVDVKVVANPGQPNERTATLTRGFTFRAGVTITSVSPNVGSPDGGEPVTILGTSFGNNLAGIKVYFGNVLATVEGVSDTTVNVRTPRWSLRDPKVSETVDLTVVVDAGQVTEKTATLSKAFTFRAVSTLYITSVTPNVGSPAGGEQVTILGNNFGSSFANTRVLFGTVQASVQSVAPTQIIVLTPRWTLRDPLVSEVVDVSVTADVGGPNEASASLPRAFTFRGAGSTQPCNSDPRLFISSLTPNNGTAAGGDVITIQGGGFGTSAATTRVEFGAFPATILSVASGSIQVSSPRRTLANPDVPEVVDITITIDVGGPEQACARLVNGFTYNRNVLTPQIFSISPVSGPNDASTRVSIFGRGFQFPMQVFVSAACRVEAPVVEVKEDRIVFLTPIASGANACLANQSVQVEVVNPATGQRATAPDSFRYYPCPSASGASPSIFPYNLTTVVVINGNNFEEPIEARFIPVGGSPFRLNVTTVSAGFINVEMPPIDPLQFGGNCANVEGNIEIRSLALTCAPVTVPVAYRIEQLRITSLRPNTQPQAGGEVINVTGANFQDPMVVEIVDDGGAVVASVTNATVSNDTALTFVAPSIADARMRQEACVVGGNVVGTQYVPTSFGLRLRNSRTGCTAILPNALIYNPTDTTCRSGPNLSDAQPPQGQICAPYPSFSFTVASGGRAPFTWSAAGLPPGLSLDPATGQIKGTPQLPAPAGPGEPSRVYNVAVTVTDSSTPAALSATRTYTLPIIDPNAPFAIQGPTNQTIASAGGSTAAFSVTPATPTAPYNFNPVTWTIVNLAALQGFRLVNPANPATPGQEGPSTAIFVEGSVPAGTYTVQLQANDNACGSVRHQATFTVTITKLGPQSGNLDISSTTLPDATLCQNYTTTLAASGGVAPYTWSAASLPPGMFLNQVTGALTGTPVLPATGPGQQFYQYQIVFTVRDSSPNGGLTASRTLTFRVNDPAGPFIISGTANQTVPSGGGSSAVFTASPVAFAPVTWTIVNQSALQGFSLTNQTGTTTQVVVAPSVPAGAYTVQLRASDSACGVSTQSSKNGGFEIDATTGHQADMTIVVTKQGPQQGNLDISTTSLTDAALCVNYTQGLSATGGVAPYTWTADTLPPGLFLNQTTGQLTGQPVLPAAGPGQQFFQYQIVFTVRDSSPNGGLTASRTLTLRVNDPAGPFVITGSANQSIPEAGGNTAEFTASPNSFPNITWSIVNLASLQGFGLTAASGTTTRISVAQSVPAGTYQVQLRARDSACGANQHVADLTVIVTKAGPQQGNLDVTTTSLLAGTICSSYGPLQLTATGGTPGYTWSATALPPGLALSSAGVLSGIPTLPAAGSGQPFTEYQVVFTVRDSSPNGGLTASRSLVLRVNDPAGPFGITGSANQGIPEAGGNTAEFTAGPNSFPNITWSIVNLASLQGFGLTAASGTATRISVAASVPAGVYTVQLRATDSACGANQHVANLTVVVTKAGPQQGNLDITTLTLPTGAICSNYGPVGLQAAGGIAPYTWTASSLPSGLFLNQTTGALSGQPVLPAAGPGQQFFQYQIVFTVRDSSPNGGLTASRTLTLRIDDPAGPFVITGSANQNVGEAGGNTSEFTAGPNTFPTITWSIVNLASLQGFGLTATSGTATRISVAQSVPAGTYTVQLRATDGACGGVQHVANLTVVVTKAGAQQGNLDITTTTLVAGAICGPYGPVQLTATGGTPGYTWSANSLPPGLALSSAGVLSGTPVLPAAGVGQSFYDYQIVFTVRDASPNGGLTASRTLALRVNDPLAPFQVNGTANQTLTFAGQQFLDTTPFTATGSGNITWSIMNLASLQGFSLTSQSGASPASTAIRVAAGVPPGMYTVQLRATDSSCGGISHRADLSVVITVIGPQQGNLDITKTTLAEATLCASYVDQMAAVGGVPPYTWSAATLPPGLFLNQTTGLLTGTPVLPAPGPSQQLLQYQIVFTVRDSSPNGGLTASRTLTLRVNDPAGGFSITGNSNEVVGPAGGATSLYLIDAAYYDFTPVTWQLVTAPAGFSLQTLSGQTTQILVDGSVAAGSYTLLLRANDNACGGVRHQADLTVVITKQPAVAGSLAITTNSLPNATLCTAYAGGLLQSSGGVAPFVWTASPLPPGLTLSQNGTGSASIIGTPILPASGPSQVLTPYSVVVTLTDSTSGSPLSVSRTITLSVTDPNAPFQIVGASNVTVPEAGGTLAATWEATPNTAPAPITWTFVNAVPAGITIVNPTANPIQLNVAGAVSPGSYTIQLRANDNSCGGVRHQADFTLVLTKLGAANNLSITSSPSPIPIAVLCNQYPAATPLVDFNAAGGVAPYSFSVNTLPPGLFLDQTTGAITGQPVLPATGVSQQFYQYQVVVTATDSSIPTPLTASQVFTLTVSDPNGPFQITGPTNANVTQGVTTNVGQFGLVNPVPAGFQPLTWEIVSVNPAPAAPFTLTSPTANTTFITVPSAVALGSYTVNFRVSDNACGSNRHQATATVTVNVIGSAFEITSTSIPDATLCASYTAGVPLTTLAASGGVAPLTWSAAGLPLGLSIDATGRIVGQPVLPAAGIGQSVTIYQPVFTVTDSSPGGSQTVSRVITLRVNDPGAPFGISGNTNYNIPAAGGAAGPFTAAPATFTPLTWSIVSITPATQGISLTAQDANPVSINVASSVPGDSYTILIRVIDNACGLNGARHQAELSVVVTKLGSQPTEVDITTTSLAEGALCSGYSATLAATGGILPYTWTWEGATLPTLPPGLTLNQTTGVISGTPLLPAPGAGAQFYEYQLKFTVRDSSPGGGLTATRNLTLRVNDPNGPFLLVGPTNQTVPSTGGNSATFTVTPNPTPVGPPYDFRPVTWEILSVTPTPPVAFNLAAQVGQTNHIIVPGAVIPNDVYTVVLQVSDNACGTNRHQSTATVVITKLGPRIVQPAGFSDATICTPYVSSPISAQYGVPPYTFSLATPIPGLSIVTDGSGLFGTLVGTPVLPAASYPTLRVNVVDSKVPPPPDTGFRIYGGINVVDPAAGYAIVAASPQSIDVTSGTSGLAPTALTISAPGPWTSTWTASALPVPGAGGFAMVPPAGTNSSQIQALAGTPAGQYAVTVTATDSSCVAHSDAEVVTINVCNVALSSLAGAFSTAGGAGLFTVTNGPGCAWTATSNAAWLTITSGASGTGSGSVNYLVPPLLPGDPARVGTITVNPGNHIYTVTQTNP